MPRSTIPSGDAIETAALGSPGRASSHPVAFDRAGGLGTRFRINFGTQSRGLYARCLRFKITVTRVPPYDLARLASGVAVSIVAGGIFTPGRSPKFRAATCLPFRPGLSWRTRDRNLDWPFVVPHIPRGVRAGRVVIRRARSRRPSAQQPPASSRAGVLLHAPPDCALRPTATSRRGRRGTAGRRRTRGPRAAPSWPTARPWRGCRGRSRSWPPTGGPSAG